MAYTFDGPNKLIILSAGTTVLDVKDLYSRWKDWVAVSDNSKYLPAVVVLGGDPLPGGRYLGTTYFIENGWKIRPYEGNHTLVVSGNMYSRDGSDPFVNTIGSYNVRIMITVSNLVDTVATGGGVGTVAEVRDAVWNATQASYTAAGSMGEAVSAAGSAGNPWIGDLTTYNTPGTAGKILKDIGLDVATVKTQTDTVETTLSSVQTDLTTIKSYTDTVESSLTAVQTDLTTIKSYTDTLETSATSLQTTANTIAGYTDTLESSVSAIQTVTDTMPTAANVASAVRTELTNELAHILTLANNPGLTTNQATMLLEIYKLYGLDPTAPLVVTNNNRTAGAGVVQTVQTSDTQTVITRV
jgi:hypothetical protein